MNHKSYSIHSPLYSYQSCYFSTAPPTNCHRSQMLSIKKPPSMSHVEVHRTFPSGTSQQTPHGIATSEAQPFFSAPTACPDLTIDADLPTELCVGTNHSLKRPGLRAGQRSQHKNHSQPSPLPNRRNSATGDQGWSCKTSSEEREQLRNYMICTLTLIDAICEGESEGPGRIGGPRGLCGIGDCANGAMWGRGDIGVEWVPRGIVAEFQ